MKKLDKLVLNAFLGPFTITFLVVVFILLNVNMLKYFDDIIGKGLDYDVLAQLFFYFAVFTIPTALPLAVLLSSLIAFGNLGEHFELTAIKSAGVSLVRTIRPIFVVVVLLTAVAFHANNSLVPKAALEAYSLLYDIKQKKPALDLREGAFYNGINDISIKVNHKFPDGITLKDVIVYDHRKNDGNKEVTVADSGKMYSILNDRYLKFELFNGYNYVEGATTEREMTGARGRGKSSETLSRSKFSKTQVVFDLSSFQLERTDKKWFQGNRIMRNLNELEGDIDSMKREVLSQRLSNYQNFPAQFTYHGKGDSIIMPTEVYKHKLYRDSLISLPYLDKMSKPEEAIKPTVAESKFAQAKKSETGVGGQKRAVLERKHAEIDSPAVVLNPAPTIADSIVRKIDSLFQIEGDRSHYSAIANLGRQTKTQIMNINSSIENYKREQTTFEIQWHKIFANSFACIAMFLIGAPLGAIIKRGGLGVPFLVSILFFIIYYVLTMQGEKLAKQGTVSVEAGVWMADAVLFMVGMFFLRQARVDARLFEADSYNVALHKFKRWGSRYGLFSRSAKAA